MWSTVVPKHRQNFIACGSSGSPVRVCDCEKGKGDPCAAWLGRVPAVLTQLWKDSELLALYRKLNNVSGIVHRFHIVWGRSWF